MTTMQMIVDDYVRIV